MHKIQERAVVVDGQVVVRPMMYIALTYDHRIIDGREAVQFWSPSSNAWKIRRAWCSAYERCTSMSSSSARARRAIPAAIRAGQNKLKVACVDEWKNTDGSHAFGGTCLNAGCIPSKALLESSELYQRAKDEFAVHGIKLGDVKLDLARCRSAARPSSRP